MKGLAILKVTPDLLVELLKGMKEDFKGNYEVIENGLPEDAELIDVCLEDHALYGPDYIPAIFLKIESASFPRTERGEKLTILDCPVFKSKRD